MKKKKSRQKVKILVDRMPILGKPIPRTLAPLGSLQVTFVYTRLFGR